MPSTDKNENNEVDREIEFGSLAEQKDETHYDRRDDSGIGRISFPEHKLYGRDDELLKLHGWYSSLHTTGGSSMYVFLGGYSGSGKSALIEEFIKQIESKRDDGQNYTCYIPGKFGQLKARRPFSAISQAMDQYVRALSSKLSKKELETLRARLAEFDITVDSEYAALLSDVLMPGLKDLLQEELSDSSTIEKMQPERREEEDSCALSVALSVAMDLNAGYDMNDIKYAFQNFIKAVAAHYKPITIFIDDLQWADDASFQLLTGLLKDKSLKQVFFIGAFRINEVDEFHPLTKLMKDVEAANGLERVKKIDVSNLSPTSISEFIADSIEREPGDIALIADVVYTKTLGNMFFVKQALEELVRKNVLYFDVISFQWQFGDVNRVELENMISDDIVETVLSKLRTLPKLLQTVLALAAYTNVTFHLDLLGALLSAKSVVLEAGGLQPMMKLAYKEGVVVQALNAAASGDDIWYKFAHDRIREAACAIVPAGNERDQLLLSVAKVLLARACASPGKDGWMFFVSASHLNSLPARLIDPIQLAELNLTVGKMASSKGAFSDAAVFLQAGVDRLDPASCWKEHYILSLELKNCLMDAEYFLGNADKVLDIAEEIYKNAKKLPDKSRAHIRHVEAYVLKTNSDYGQSVFLALDILEQYGVHIPKSPSQIQARFQALRLKVSKRNLPCHCLAEFPLATDLETIALFRLAAMTLIYLNLAKQQKNHGIDRLRRLAGMLEEKILRIALENQVITKDMTLILSTVATNLRERGQYREAVEVANTATSLIDQFPDERSSEFLKAKMGVNSHNGLKKNFRFAVPIYWQLHKQFFAKGEVLFFIGCAVLGTFGYLNSSLRLDAFFESKLLNFEEASNTVGQSSSAYTFAAIRQCVYNLQGGDKSSSNPVEIKGVACDEEKVQLQLQGFAQMLFCRQTSVVRLMLAVIFGDEAAMQLMLDQLEEDPIADPILERLHHRLTYTGFAALILSDTSERCKKRASISMDFFRKLSRFGSANGRPVYACMKALRKPSVVAFNEAIHECTNEGMCSLAALMNERCGLMLLNQHNSNVEVTGQDYLKHAMSLYNDWGASGKVLQLQAKHKFLQSAMTEKILGKQSSIVASTLLLASGRSDWS